MADVYQRAQKLLELPLQDSTRFSVYERRELLKFLRSLEAGHNAAWAEDARQLLTNVNLVQGLDQSNKTFFVQDRRDVRALLTRIANAPTSLSPPATPPASVSTPTPAPAERASPPVNRHTARRALDMNAVAADEEVPVPIVPKPAPAPTSARPLRELIGPEDHVLVTVHGKQWSQWFVGITPVSKENWYQARPIPLNALPTNQRGVYEIAVSRNDADPSPSVVYCGRARIGTTLRRRLQTYVRSGGHIKMCLEHMLVEKCYVYFRWIILENDQQCDDQENVMLAAYDYAFNKASNRTPRDPFDVKLRLPSGIVVPLLDHYAQIDDAVAQDDPQVAAILASFTALTSHQRAVAASAIQRMQSRA